MVTRFAFITFQMQQFIESETETRSVFVDFGKTEPMFVNMQIVIGHHFECDYINVLDFKFFTLDEFVFLTKNLRDDGPLKIVCE